MTGNLTQTVLSATGINGDSLQNEFNNLITQNGFHQESLTIDQLREVMAEYLNQVFLELAESNEKSA